MKVKELLEQFDRLYITTNLKPNTQYGYRNNINNHIIPIIGDIEIEDLDIEHCDIIVENMKDKGLSNTTIKYSFAVLRKALNFGKRRKLCDNNVVSDYDIPKVKKLQMKTYTENQMHKIITKCNQGPLKIALLLACHYGLRRGEILGLRWEDVQPEYITICQSMSVINKKLVINTPKSGKTRLIKILEEDYKVFKDYNDNTPYNENGFLIRYKDGSTYYPAALDHAFITLCDREKLPRIRVHDLRHSYATFMLRSGINPKIVSEVLGHSSVKVTLDIYSHCDLSMQQACLSAIKY